MHVARVVKEFCRGSQMYGREYALRGKGVAKAEMPRSKHGHMPFSSRLIQLGPHANCPFTFQHDSITDIKYPTSPLYIRHNIARYFMESWTRALHVAAHAEENFSVKNKIFRWHWTRWGSNPRPHASTKGCKASALPLCHVPILTGIKAF